MPFNLTVPWVNVLADCHTPMYNAHSAATVTYHLEVQWMSICNMWRKNAQTNQSRSGTGCKGKEKYMSSMLYNDGNYCNHSHKIEWNIAIL